MLNNSKSDSMFNNGMKVTVYSEKKSEHEKIGWHRSCYDISYFKNTIRKETNKDKYYYTATFTYDFLFNDDTVFFSYCFPYTYSDMTKDLQVLQSDPRRQQFITG